jgi:hypothetical protein
LCISIFSRPCRSEGRKNEFKLLLEKVRKKGKKIGRKKGTNKNKEGNKEKKKQS